MLQGHTPAQDDMLRGRLAPKLFQDIGCEGIQLRRANGLKSLHKVLVGCLGLSQKPRLRTSSPALIAHFLENTPEFDKVADKGCDEGAIGPTCAR